MKIKAGEMRTEAAPQASRGLAAFTQAAKRFKCTHKTAIYAGKRFHVHQEVTLVLFWILGNF